MRKVAYLVNNVPPRVASLSEASVVPAARNVIYLRTRVVCALASSNIIQDTSFNNLEALLNIVGMAILVYSLNSDCGTIHWT